MFLPFVIIVPCKFVNATVKFRYEDHWIITILDPKTTNYIVFRSSYYRPLHLSRESVVY